METPDTAERREPSLATVKAAPEATPAGEPYAHPIRSVHFGGTKEKDDSLDLMTLGATFSELRVGTPEGKEKEKEKAGAGVDHKGAHEPTSNAHFTQMPSSLSIAP